MDSVFLIISITSYHMIYNYMLSEYDYDILIMYYENHNLFIAVQYCFLLTFGTILYFVTEHIC